MIGSLARLVVSRERRKWSVSSHRNQLTHFVFFSPLWRCQDAGRGQLDRQKQIDAPGEALRRGASNPQSGSSGSKTRVRHDCWESVRTLFRFLVALRKRTNCAFKPLKRPEPPNLLTYSMYIYIYGTPPIPTSYWLYYIYVCVYKSYKANSCSLRSAVHSRKPVLKESRLSIPWREAWDPERLNHVAVILGLILGLLKGENSLN